MRIRMGRINTVVEESYGNNLGSVGSCVRLRCCSGGPLMRPLTYTSRDGVVMGWRCPTCGYLSNSIAHSKGRNSCGISRMYKIKDSVSYIENEATYHRIVGVMLKNREFVTDEDFKRLENSGRCSS